MEIKFIKNILFYCLLSFIFLKKQIICKNNITCFEYSCEECNSPEYGNCTKCHYGWTLIDGTCPCFDSSCAVCSTRLGNSMCHLCKKGYDGSWDKCYCSISNCEQCGENECLDCEPGYIYNNKTNKCEKFKDEKIKCNDPNCDICFSELKGACYECKEGFYERKGKCIKLEKVNETGLCPYNYYNKNNYCLPICYGIDCPVKYDSSRNLCPSNKCLVCKNNVLKIWNECDNSDECSSIEGCLNCISNDECVFCNRGYYLLGGLCYKCITGCSICYNNYSCKYCLSGFELTPDKQCILTYNYDFDMGEYNKYKELMLYRKGCSIDECLNCTFFFYAERCQKCSKGYGTDYNECVKCPSNCNNCKIKDEKLYCIECESGYRINNEGLCTLICSDSKCLDCYLDNSYSYFSSKEYCRKCISGYVPNEEKCSKCSNWEGCVGCIFKNGKELCDYCYRGYYLKDGNCTRCSDNNCSDCYFSKGKEYCSSCYNDRYMPFEEKCIKCTDENCLSCQMKNGKEQCIKCESGYEINEEKCQVCTLENCLKCYFNEGQEKCLQCEVGYETNKEGKCLNCSVIHEKCKYCRFDHYDNGRYRDICYKCEIRYQEDINEICRLICSDNNCRKCSLNQNIEVCDECKEGYKKENDKCIHCEDSSCLKCDDDVKICTQCIKNSNLFNGKCYDESRIYYDCSIFNLDYCSECSGSGRCEKCFSDYEADSFGRCKKQYKKLKKIIIPIIIIVILLIVIVVICILKKRRNAEINEIRINQPNINNHNNMNNNYNNVNLYRTNQEIFSSEKIKFEKDLTDEFNRQKINLEKNKLCQVCKNKNGKYISDCGCIVCQEHSNFKSIIKDGQNYKICFNCGKAIKDLTLIETNCHICLEEVPSVCHFKCGCAIEVCEKCYIKCKKLSKKCPGCRGNI